MKKYRRLALSLVVATASAAASFWAFAARSPVSADAALQMRRATAHFDSLAAGSSRQTSLSTTIALGYLERLRLGVGGAYRLMAFAADDPRLDDSTRTLLSWAMLARIRGGDTYRVDPDALAGLGPTGASGTVSGAAHLALIDRTIVEASDPRAGELAIRLGYELAAAEGTVSGDAPRDAAEAAALVRDRVLAQRDVRTVFERARDERIEAPEAVERLRADRALLVEQPSTLGLSEPLELEGMRLATKVRDEIRTLAAAPPVTAAAPSTLDTATAMRLWAAGTRLPPESPIVVALRVSPDAFPEFGGATEASNLIRRPPNEETLVAAAAIERTDSVARLASARALLRAAVQLRAYAQEVPWFPGDETPTTTAVASALGVTTTFDRSVPDAWRGYYTRMVGTAIGDMTSVLGGITFAGMRVHIGAAELPDTALAMHDPATRTIHLSVASSAGTLAHELAHDLDWQTARRLYPGVGGYGTDHAARDASGRLGHSVRGLAAARLDEGNDTAASPSWNARPAEIFARDVDWFVASAMAATGRSDGYLTAVQDPMLAGYAGANAGDMLGGGASSLLGAVDAMAFVAPRERDAFTARWDASSRIDPTVLLARVLATPVPRVTSRLEPRAVPPGGDAVLATPIVCRASKDVTAADEARDRLVEAAIGARARGMAKRWAAWFDLGSRPPWAWSILGVAPWSPSLGDEMVARIRGRVGARVWSDLASIEGKAGAQPPALFAGQAGCAAR